MRGADRRRRFPRRETPQEAREFIDAYPEVAAKLAQDRSAIPDRVWERVRAGERLLAAYETEAAIADASAKGERIRELEARLAEAKQAQTNAPAEHRQRRRRRRRGGARPRRPRLERRREDNFFWPISAQFFERRMYLWL